MKELSTSTFNSITNWIDENIGWWNYFGIRSLIKSAADNTLDQEYPQVPYSARELLLWAEENDKQSFLMTPGGQAIDGENMWHEVAGTPEINPMTGKRNSEEDRNGFVKNTWNDTQILMKKTLIYGGVILAGAIILKPMSEEFAKKLAKGGKK